MFANLPYIGYAHKLKQRINIHSKRIFIQFYYKDPLKWYGIIDLSKFRLLKNKPLVWATFLIRKTLSQTSNQLILSGLILEDGKSELLIFRNSTGVSP